MKGEPGYYCAGMENTLESKSSASIIAQNNNTSTSTAALGEAGTLLILFEHGLGNSTRRQK